MRAELRIRSQLGRFRPIQLPMASRRRAPRDSRSNQARPGAYVLIVRGPDGQPRQERFNDAATYRARLMTLQDSRPASVSVEDIVDLLDA